MARLEGKCQCELEKFEFNCPFRDKYLSGEYLCPHLKMWAIIRIPLREFLSKQIRLKTNGADLKSKDCNPLKKRHDFRIV